jgi:hypothetical protein
VRRNASEVLRASSRVRKQRCKLTREDLGRASVFIKEGAMQSLDRGESAKQKDHSTSDTTSIIHKSMLPE